MMSPELVSGVFFGVLLRGFFSHGDGCRRPVSGVRLARGGRAGALVPTAVVVIHRTRSRSTKFGYLSALNYPLDC